MLIDMIVFLYNNVEGYYFKIVINLVSLIIFINVYLGYRRKKVICGESFV